MTRALALILLLAAMPASAQGIREPGPPSRYAFAMSWYRYDPAPARRDPVTTSRYVSGPWGWSYRIQRRW